MNLRTLGDMKKCKIIAIQRKEEMMERKRRRILNLILVEKVVVWL